jgi:hypothetical protein
MSEDDTPQASGQAPGSLFLAWLGATLGTGLCTTLLYFGLVIALNRGDDAVTILWVVPYFFAAAAAEMLALTLFMGFVEMGGTPRSGRAWLIGGLIAACPLALIGFAIANMGDRMEGAPPFDYVTLWVPALVLAAGLAGAAAGFRVRHRSWP